MKMLNAISIVLLIVGRLNWGLWGVFEFDFIASLFGGNTVSAAKIVYILVGLAAVYRVRSIFAVQKCWLRCAGFWVGDRYAEAVPIVAQRSSS